MLSKDKIFLVEFGVPDMNTVMNSLPKMLSMGMAKIPILEPIYLIADDYAQAVEKANAFLEAAKREHQMRNDSRNTGEIDDIRDIFSHDGSLDFSKLDKIYNESQSSHSNDKDGFDDDIFKITNLKLISEKVLK